MPPFLTLPSRCELRNGLLCAFYGDWYQMFFLLALIIIFYLGSCYKYRYTISPLIIPKIPVQTLESPLAKTPPIQITCSTTPKPTNFSLPIPQKHPSNSKPSTASSRPCTVKVTSKPCTPSSNMKNICGFRSATTGNGPPSTRSTGGCSRRGILAW